MERDDVHDGVPRRDERDRAVAEAVTPVWPQDLLSGGMVVARFGLPLVVLLALIHFDWLLINALPRRSSANSSSQ